MKQFVIDLDSTITKHNDSETSEKPPNTEVINMLRTYCENRFFTATITARNMRTSDGKEGKIISNAVPVIIDRLAKHDVPYDELRVGKRRCDTKGIYVYDKAIQPQEFVSHSDDQIIELINAGS